MFNSKEDLFRNLLEDIKKKKELRFIDNSFILERINEYIKENPKILNKEVNTRSKEYKNLVKDVRRRLRIIYSVYYFDVDKEDLDNKFVLKLDLAEVKDLDFDVIGKRAEFIINSKRISMFTERDHFEKDISDLVADGENFIKILPKNDFEIINLEIVMEWFFLKKGIFEDGWDLWTKIKGWFKKRRFN